MKTSNTSGLFLRDFFIAVWLAFIATWPQILTNLTSDILARWLHIETGNGTRLVIALAIATLFMFLLFNGTHRLSRRSIPGSATLGNAKMQILLQGSLFSLAIALSLICDGVFAGPFTLSKLFHFLAALIPALEGAIGRRIIATESERLHSEIMDYIDVLLQSNNRVTQRMLEGHIQGFRSGTLLPPDVLTSLVRTRMVKYVNEEQYNRRRRGDLVVLDTYREPDNWKLLAPQAT